MNVPSDEGRTGQTYGRSVLDATADRVSSRYPQVTVERQTFDTGVWFGRVEFIPATPDAIQVWLTANSDRQFIITAGDSFRWDAEFEPEYRDDQIDELVAVIRDLAENGYTVTRRNRLLGAYSESHAGSAGGKLSRVMEQWTGWNPLASDEAPSEPAV